MEKNEQKNSPDELIFQAKKAVAKAMAGLESLGICVPERHNVLVPGTSTTPKNSKRLLKKAIEEAGEVGVYAGVATCPYICKYCRYYLKTGKPEDLEQMVGEDVSNIITEMDIVGKYLDSATKSARTTSVYLGGGTPTLMSDDQIGVFFGELRGHYRLDDKTEITLEGTPDTLRQEKIDAFAREGVNRISIGIQRLDDKWLASMNRKHSVADVFEALNLLNKSGIRYNIDLIYGFDGQTVESFVQDLEKIMEYLPTEITLYRFEDQKKTDDREIKVGRSKDSELIYTMQEVGRIIMLEKGYIEGPDCWFTKPDVHKAQVYEDRWNRQIPLVGYGSEAYSYSKYQQQTNLILHKYFEALKNGDEIVNSDMVYEYVDGQMDLRRMVFELKSTFSTSFNDEHRIFFISLVDAGLGEIFGHAGKSIFKLNRHGLIVVEEIMQTLVQESDKLGNEKPIS